jgi:hypothetical protein
MTNESVGGRPDAQAPGWAQALTDLERSLQDASAAIVALRRGLEAIGFNLTAADVRPEVAAEPQPVEAVESEQEALPAPAPSMLHAVPAGGLAEETSTGASFDRLWDKIERERSERAAPPEDVPDTRRGLELLPQHYLMTVEDREGRVSLVPLHRGLQTLPGIEEVTLVSYANGVPVISLRTKSELDLDLLGEVVGRVMDRNCEVINQDTGKLYLRMKSASREEGS